MVMRVATRVPVQEVRPLVRGLVQRYGSIHAAGEAYDERYGYAGRYRQCHDGGTAYHGNGTRLFTRILNEKTKYVSDRTYDQIETLVWS